ncbi:MAG: alpha/beta hydrolase [Acidobacteriota bacterium]|nr:MAG: alpha/beta hydrolase [Acidobacteriota bacterium]
MKRERFEQDDREEQTVLLPDGRVLGFAEYGDPGGWPVFFFHGVPGSRYFFRLADDAAKRQGARIIAPERPGYGRSEFYSERSLLDWPDDMRVLAESLSIDRFSVAGISGGGPYASACGVFLREHIECVGLISGMGPIDHPEVERMITSRQKLARFLFRDAPGFVAGLAFALSLLLRIAPGIVVRIARQVPEPGREVLENPTTGRQICEGFSEAFRGGTRGVVLDIRLLTRPWGFSLREVTVPVFLWHGEQDFDVPVLLARLVAETLPEVEAQFLPGAGHAWIISNFETVLRKLVPRNSEERGRQLRVAARLDQ